MTGFLPGEKPTLPELPEDDLDAAITGPKDPVKLAANMMPAQFKEDCPKCRGSGRFVTWGGRDLGKCNKCGGSGKLTFKTSREDRKAAKVNRAASTARHAQTRLEAFEAAHPEIATWWTGSNYPFAIAMREAVTKYGDLSEKQFAAAQGAANKLAAAKAQSAARIQDAKAIDTSKIEAAFSKARSILKSPKLRVAGLIISFAKAESRNAGALYVKSATRTNAEGGGLYLGKIMGGKFIRSRECEDAEEARLLEIAHDPLGAAIAYGRLTGNCACCGRGLTDPESVARGIGPVCAENFGW